MSKKHFLFLLAACVLFVSLFNPAHLYFLSDDWDSLLFSLQPSNIFHSFRPLSDASLLLDYKLWGMNAEGFHVTNYVLHFACAFCVYHVLKELLALRYNDVLLSNLSLACSLFFLFYPFHSEAVFWIVGRGAVLCTLFGLLCLLFFIKKEENRFYYLLSLFSFALSLLSYEEAWVIPIIITVLACVFSKQNKTKRILQVSLFWFVFLLYLIGRFYFTQNLIGTPYGSERMMNFNLLFLARNFVVFVFRSFVPPLQSSIVFASACAVVALFLAIILFFNKKKINFALLISSAFFLISLIPVLPLGIDTHDTESERFLYFPSAFFVLFLAQLFVVISERKYKTIYGLLLMEIIPLWLSYDSFEKSSDVEKQTVSAIQKIRSADTLFTQQLPDQYKGAFIFRNGFTSMVKLETDNAIKHVEILSTSELFQPSKNYSLEEIQLPKNEFSNNAFISWTEQKVILKK